MNLINAEVKISDQFGIDYINSILESIKSTSSVILVSDVDVEPELFFLNYEIDAQKITFMSEGMAGTTLIGRRQDVSWLINILKTECPELIN